MNKNINDRLDNLIKISSLPSSVKINSFNQSISVEYVELNEEKNQIEVVLRSPSNLFLNTGQETDRVWKNIFAVNEKGEIYFKEKVDAVVTEQKTIPEKIEFPEK